MKKEITLAILGGGTLGLIIAFGVWKGNSLFKIKKEIPTPTPQSVSDEQKNQTKTDQVIKISNPNSLDVLVDSPVSLSGVTNPNSIVVISSEVSDSIISSNDSGTFSQDVDLIGGINRIRITSFSPDGSSAASNLLLIYSSQFTPKEGSEKATAYIGTVTDITNSVLQIKNNYGDVQQVLTDSKTQVVDTRNNLIKTLKSSDIAIGDFIIAMGYKDGNAILSTSRIVITEALQNSTTTTFFGIVTDIGTGEITARNPKTNETVTITSKRLSQIKVNDKIIAVGEAKDGVIDARTLQTVK